MFPGSVSQLIDHRSATPYIRSFSLPHFCTNLQPSSFYTKCQEYAAQTILSIFVGLGIIPSNDRLSIWIICLWISNLSRHIMGEDTRAHVATISQSVSSAKVRFAENWVCVSRACVCARRDVRRWWQKSNWQWQPKEKQPSIWNGRKMCAKHSFPSRALYVHNVWEWKIRANATRHGQIVDASHLQQQHQLKHIHKDQFGFIISMYQRRSLLANVYLHE